MADPEVPIPEGWEDAGPIVGDVAVPEGWEAVPDQAAPVDPGAMSLEERALRTVGPVIEVGGRKLLRGGFTDQPAPPGLKLDAQGIGLLAPAVTEPESEAQAREARNARLRAAFELAKSKDGPKLARAVEISRSFNVPVRQVLPNLPEFERTAAAAEYDPEAWYTQNKLLADVLMDSPETMAAVVVDPHVGPLVQAFRKVEDTGLLKAADWAMLPVTAPTMLAASAKRLWEVAKGKPADQVLAEEEAGDAAAKEARRNQKETKFETPEAKRIRESDTFERTALTLQRRYREARASTDMAYAGAELAVLENTPGVDPEQVAQAAARAQDLRAGARPLLLGEGEVLGLAGDALQGVLSTVDNRLARAAAGGAGGVAGAVAGAVVTRSPAGAAAGARFGAAKGQTLGGLAQGFKAEMGGSYLELRDAVTDGGQRLTKAEALGGAVAYGLVASWLENLGTEAQLAPLKGQVRKLLGADPLFRAKVASLGREWLAGAATEGGTEALQSVAEQTMQYVAKSLKDERAQRGPLYNPEQAIREGTAGLIAGGGVSALSTAGSVALEAVATDRAAVTSPRQVAIIASLAEQAPVKAAPSEFAEVVRQATAETGAPAEFWVDVAAAQRLFQEQGKDDAQAELELGEAGGQAVVDAYKEAVATGGKFAVPLETVLSTWAQHPLGQALLEHSSTSESAPTAAQAAEGKALEAIQQHALEMAEAAQKELEDEDAFEDALETMRRDILEAERPTGIDKAAQHARDAVAVVRATYETLRAENPQWTRQQLLEKAGLLEYARGDEAVEGQAGKQRVRAMDAHTDLRTLLDFGGKEGGALNVEERARLLFVDPVSNLREAEAFDAEGVPEGHLVAMVTTPDAKAVNDHPDGSHDATNALLRRMAAVVAKVDPRAARIGTNFAVRVRDQQALDGLLAQLRASLPSGLTAVGALGATRQKAAEAMDALVDQQRKDGVLPARGGTAFDLSTLKATRFDEGVVLPEADVSDALLDLVGPEGKYEGREALGNRAFLDAQVPGLLSGLGWRHAKKGKFTVALDLKGLRAVNLMLGKAVGDTMLRAFGESLVRMGGQAFSAAHLSGDEYALTHDSKEALEEFVADVEADLLASGGVSYTFPDGALLDVEVGFRWGIAEGTYGQADRELNRRKLAEPVKRKVDPDDPAASPRDLGRVREAGRGPEEQGRDSLDHDSGPGGLQRRQARALRRRGGERSRPFRDVTSEAEADLGGVGGFGAEDGRPAGGVGEAFASPETLADAREWVGRMRNAARKARLTAWLDYAEGKAGRPLEQRPTRSEATEMLDLFGPELDDPEGSFLDTPQSQGIGPSDYKGPARGPKRARRGEGDRSEAARNEARLADANRARGVLAPDATGRLLFQEDVPVKSLGEIRSDAEAAGIKLDVSDGAIIEVSRIVVPEGERGKGAGSRVMQQIVDFADRAGKAVALTPSTDFGGSSVKRLEAFYRRFGFVPNKGRAKDFATRASMIRPVRPARLFQSVADVAPFEMPGGARRVTAIGQHPETGETLVIVGAPVSRYALDDVDRAQSLVENAALYREKLDELIALVEKAGTFSALDVEALKRGDPSVITDDRADRLDDAGERLAAVTLGLKTGLSIQGQAARVFTLAELRSGAADFLLEDEAQAAQVWADEFEQRTGRMRQDEADLRSTPRGYFERPPRGARGVDRVLRVFLNQKADRSTVMHESAHGFLEMLANVAEEPDASERTTQRWADTLKWLGVENRDAIKREHHEKFARAFEAYLREGKAPKKELWGVFARFKAWLTRIYRTVAQLNVELDEDVKRLFDRMLATDEEIQRANGKRGASPWKTAEEAGLTPEQWAERQEAEREALAFATRDAALAHERKALDVAEADWKEQLEAARVDAEAEYEALPAQVAKRFLEGNPKDLLDADVAMEPVVLDRRAVEEAVGASGARRFRTRAQGATHPDEVAPLVKYPTGRDMLQAIASLPAREKWVEQRAQALAEERDAQGAAELRRLREAVAGGVQRYTEERIAREWAEWGRRAEPGSDVSELGRQVALEALKRAGGLVVERMRVGRLNPGAVLAKERQAARVVRQAALKGAFDAARDWFRQQSLQVFTHRAVLDAVEFRGRFERLAESLATPESRARLGKASPALRDAVDYLLGSFGLGPETDFTGETLQAAAAVLEESGTVPGDWFEALRTPEMLGSGDYRNLRVADLRHLDAALRQLLAEARFRNEVQLGEKTAEREATIEEMVREGGEVLPVKRPPGAKSSDTVVDTLASFASAVDGFLLNPADLVRDLTGDNIDSTWWRAVVEPLRRAKTAEAEFLKRLVEPVTQAIEALPEDVRARLRESIDGRALFPGHIDPLLPRKRHELLMMALNVGNAGNLQRLTDGRRISVEEVARALDTLTDAELRWVEQVWDAVGALREESFALEERETGLRPRGVEPVPFRLPSGRVLKGGYFPAVYDRRASVLGERQAGEAVAGLLDPRFVRPGTSHGHLKGRVERVEDAALSLDLSVIYRHLAQVAHDLAFREPIKSVGSLVLDKRVQQVLRERLGDGKARTFLQWLKDVGGASGASVTPLDGAISWSRSAFAHVLLGWKVSTALGDFANLAAAVASTPLKAKHLGAAMRDFMAAPLVSREKALAASPWLRAMGDTTRRQFDEAMRTMADRGLPKPLQWYKDHAFALMEGVSVATATPVWMGAYRQAVAEGRTHDDAARFADDVLSRVFPSHAAVDVAGILRDRGLLGLSTVMYGYLSVAYRAQHRLIAPLFTQEFRAATLGGKVKTLSQVSGRLLGFYVAFSVLGELLMGRGPEAGDADDEEPDNHLLRWRNWFLRKLVAGPLSTLPFFDTARAVEALLTDKPAPSPRSTPLASMAELVGKQARTALDGEKAPLERSLAALKLVLEALGLPVAPIDVQGRYLLDVALGDVQPEGPLDVASGLLYGQRENQPANLLRPTGGE